MTYKVIDSGVVSYDIGIGMNAVSDGSKRWEDNILRNRLLRISTQHGITETKSILGNNAQTIVLNSGFSVNIRAGATYEILD